MDKSKTVILELTFEEFEHIMGSVSQDDAEYVICPDALKEKLHKKAEEVGSKERIGWG